MKRPIFIICMLLSVMTTTFFTSCSPEKLLESTERATEGEDGETDDEEDDGGSQN